MAGSMERSWRLIKASTAVLNEDGELLFLPILSAAAALTMSGALIWQAVDSGAFATLKDHDTLSATPSLYAWLFVFYIVQYFIVIFFNTALVGAAIERLDGGDPTVRSALGLAFARLPQILGYAVISATVGMVLRVIGERGGIIGRLVAGSLGLTWTIVTFLVVPLLAAEGLGPMEAIERSGQLLRKTWGENLIGSSGISIVTGIVAAIAAMAGVGGWFLFASGNALGIPLIGLAVFFGVGAIAFGSALSAVYAATLYYYAVLGAPPAGFDKDLVRNAFETKESTA